MRFIKSLFVFLAGLFALLYLLNFGGGIIEFIPDNVPIIGNLDEVTATILLLNCLAYFGLDLRHLLHREPSIGDKNSVDGK